MSYSAKDMVAVRRGKIYCAPFCGGQCTWAAYVKAGADGTKLLRRLMESTGLESWKVRVWENLGWHFEVTALNGRLRVAPPRHHAGGYMVFLNIDGHSGGEWTGCGRTPEAAINEAIAAFEHQVKRHQRLDSNLRHALPSFFKET